MDQNIIIRKAIESDAEQLIQHMRIVLKENSHFLGTSLEDYHPTLEEEMTWINTHNQNGLVLVAEVNITIIGFLYFRLSTSKKFSHKGIFGMTIQELYTNKGIGSALIKQMLEWAEKNKRVEKITLEVFSNNERAIHLYKKHGFIEEGRLVKNAKLGPNEYVDDILMSRFV
ncbi:GNAT family N-acetyltransferase [Bacillus sp. CGMCC 1.16607]|uniref:GNAT family N-acetyltransferase n=1 Tax=Bacillus sp. CGMCC 1.16607 TaxID=3351842 RepID=UPI00362C589F